MKKLLSIVLTLALLITLVPAYGPTTQVEAAGSYFLFPNEKDVKSSARIVSNKYVSLTGTINGVVGSSISYKVEQVTASSDTPLNSTQDISTGITTTGNNVITISSIELFPGMNKITFKGVAGTSTVEEHIYIEYRDSPMLNDLEILFENQTTAVAETGVTMLYSNATNAASTGNITIIGKAPNATSVTVEVNGDSFDFNVGAATSDYRFSTSQLTIRKGMNTLKFKINNGGQIVETTRLVNLYNGEVTHFEEKLIDDTKVYDITFGGEYSVTSNNLKITGKAIIPLPLYNVAVSTADGSEINVTDDAALRAALLANMSMTITGETDSPVLTITAIEPAVLNATSTFMTVSYSYNLSAINLSRDTAINYQLKAPNKKVINTSDARKITLRDGTKAYIADVNYLSGFDSTMTSTAANGNAVATNQNQLRSLQGTDIPSAGVEVYSIPMAVEMLIANHNAIGTVNLSNIVKVQFNNKEYTPKIIVDNNGVPITEVVTQTVNGNETSYLRIFLQFNTLDKSGVNNASFWLEADEAINERKQYIFKLQYGPYVKYESVVDGMSVEYDSYKDTNAQLISRLGGLAGRIMNIANNSDIRYVDTSTLKKSAFLYLNNVQIDIQSFDQANSPNSPLFSPKGVTINSQGRVTGITDQAANDLTAIMNKAGENTLKFMFYTSTYSYESTIKFSIVPTNLPIIPALNTDGVYPYSNGTWPPVGNDAKFTLSNGAYTTKEAEFNVYGTFDFIDLGTTRSEIDSTMNLITEENYIVKISNPNWNNDVEWNLSKEFLLTDRNRVVEQTPYNQGQGNASTVDANITFYYDKDNESFFFDIVNQSMPEDGSPLVYVISVFNAGEAGPRATYRLEVNPISIPYSIKSPVIEERVTNKNFVEFIISSPGADSVMVGKEAAEKVVYLDYANGGTTRVNAFKAVVKDLKANKDTKISFTITRGQNTITDSINVKYVPTNIPGAQYLEEMKNSHKVFNNALTLTFPRATNLIRSEFNEAKEYASQVYSGHSILFAIGNSEDGIVDRHMYEGQAPNYTASSQSTGNLYIKYRFEDLASRYIKASPLFWIDAGLADDPATSSYDSISTGLDPYPFPNIDGKYTGNFETRYQQYNRELIPSNVGSLTLTYDTNIVANAGTSITVFRFDPVELTWENIGGVVDTKKGTITVPFTKFGYYVVGKLTRSYNDIIDHSYAREAMEAIYAKGVMNPLVPVSQFGGDRYVTRGEFTRMIVRALDLPLNYSGALHFTYYPETITNASNQNAIYDYRYIETAARAGIVNGTRPGFFDEDVQLSRQDAAVILARALELKLETDSTKAKTQLDKAFKDGGNFDFYAIPAVLAIQKKGFIVGKPISTTDPKAGSMYDPKARMLRSDAAIIMSRVMADLKKLPTIYS